MSPGPVHGGEEKLVLLILNVGWSQNFKKTVGQKTIRCKYVSEIYHKRFVNVSDVTDFMICLATSILGSQLAASYYRPPAKFS